MKLEGKPEYEVMLRDAGPAPNSTGGREGQLNMKRDLKEELMHYLFPTSKVMYKGSN